jgi:hypothetical protein
MCFSLTTALGGALAAEDGGESIFSQAVCLCLPGKLARFEPEEYRTIQVDPCCIRMN